MLALLSDRQCLPFRFGDSEALDSVGDLPVMSVQTYTEHAKAFHGGEVRQNDVLSKTAVGKVAVDEFFRDTTYLGRYQAMIDVLVYSLLAPEIPLPKHLALYDYPVLQGNAPPADRKPGTTYDLLRRHALLLWGACGKDPAPESLSLPLVLLGTSRVEQKALLDAVVERIKAEREADGALRRGPFESQFSPFEFYLSMDGEPNANALANSYHRFHGELSEKISNAAREVIKAKVR